MLAQMALTPSVLCFVKPKVPAFCLDPVESFCTKATPSRTPAGNDEYDPNNQYIETLDEAAETGIDLCWPGYGPA